VVYFLFNTGCFRKNSA